MRISVKTDMFENLFNLIWLLKYLYSAITENSNDQLKVHKVSNFLKFYLGFDEGRFLNG